MDDKGRQSQLSENVHVFAATVREQFFCQIRAKNWRRWLQPAAVSALLLSHSVTALAHDFVYVAVSAGLERFRIGPDGALISLGVVSSSSPPLSITIDRRKRFLWEVDNDGTIKSFQIDRVTGELKPGQSVKLGLATGASVATQDNNYFYAASAAFAPLGDYHALVRYKVNRVTGELTEPLVTQLKGYIVAPTAMEVDWLDGIRLDLMAASERCARSPYASR
jgi:hypothetical protein